MVEAKQRLLLEGEIRSLNRNKRTVTFACEVEATKSIKPISKNSPKSSKIPDHTREAHVLRDFK